MKKIIIAILLILAFFSNALAVTVDFYVSQSDGYNEGTAAKGGDSIYPPGTSSGLDQTSTDFSVTKYKISGKFYTAVYACRFNTASLPDDATISSATLNLYVVDVMNQDSRNMSAEYFTWTTFDYSPIYSDLVGTNAFNVSLGDFSNGATVSISLSSPNTYLSKTGKTGFRLGISGGEPSGYTYVQIKGYASSNHIPKLSVTYTTGYGHKVNGVTSAAKVNGVAVPAKVNGL